MNVYLTWEADSPRYLRVLREAFPDLLVTESYLEVMKLARAGSIDRLVVVVGAIDAPFTGTGYVRGQTVAEHVHEIDPGIPVLVLDGRCYEMRKGTEPTPELLVHGFAVPLKGNPNETYLRHCPDWLDKVVRFFRGETFESDDLGPIIPGPVTCIGPDGEEFQIR